MWNDSKQQHIWWLSNKYWGRFENLFFVKKLLFMLYDIKLENEVIESVSCQYKWVYIDDVVVETQTKKILCQCKLGIDKTYELIENIFQSFYKQYYQYLEDTNPQKKTQVYYLVSRNICWWFEHLLTMIEPPNLENFKNHIVSCKDNDEFGIYDFYIKIQLAIENLSNVKPIKFWKYHKNIDEEILKHIHWILIQTKIVQNFNEDDMVALLSPQSLSTVEAKNIIAMIYYHSTIYRWFWNIITKENLKQVLDSGWIVYTKDKNTYGELNSVEN